MERCRNQGRCARSQYGPIARACLALIPVGHENQVQQTFRIWNSRSGSSSPGVRRAGLFLRPQRGGQARYCSGPLPSSGTRKATQFAANCRFMVRAMARWTIRMRPTGRACMMAVRRVASPCCCSVIRSSNWTVRARARNVSSKRGFEIHHLEPNSPGSAVTALEDRAQADVSRSTFSTLCAPGNQVGSFRASATNSKTSSAGHLISTSPVASIIITASYRPIWTVCSILETVAGYKFNDTAGSVLGLLHLGPPPGQRSDSDGRTMSAWALWKAA
jgi:hypothetical protein